MAKLKGDIVESISTVGSAGDGQYLRLTLKMKNKATPTLFFPLSLFSGLMSALTAAASFAYREQMSKFKSEKNIVSISGYTDFRPTGFSLARSKDSDGDSILLMRLKKDELPIFDAVLKDANAEQLALSILRELKKPIEDREPNVH